MERDSSTKLALAIAVLRHKLHLSSSSSEQQHDLQRLNEKWKKKAKDRKRELMMLKEELKDIQDGMHQEMFPQSVSCKCYFFENCGKLSPRSRVQWRDENNYKINQINQVLHRRFLRLVRLNERRKRLDDIVKQRHFKELNEKDEIEQLVTSADFLVEIAGIQSSVMVNSGHSRATSSHQAVDFILASTKKLLSSDKDCELIEGIINRLIMRLNKSMCIPPQQDGFEKSDSDAQSHVQHIIRKLGSDPYIGQRTVLSVCQRISALADSLLFMDPFDDALPNAHSSMFMMIQLIEFLVSDYAYAWTSGEGFENQLFEEWVRCILQAKKALELLENRNGLYLLYMDRVIGELAKQVTRISHSGMQITLNADVLETLFQ